MAGPASMYSNAVAGFFLYKQYSLPEFLPLWQTTANMWHGCGYKDAAKDNKPPAGKSMMHFDHAMVPGPVFVETKSRYWNCEKEKILAWLRPQDMTGYSSICQPWGGAGETFSHKDMKTVIWMPTFRKSEVLISAENEIELPFQLPALESEAELKALDVHLRECGIFLIIKKHPLQSGWSLDEGAYTNIRYVTEEMLQKSGIQLYETGGTYGWTDFGLFPPFQ